MGVLDDAIRQHLELKRAHGADESDLQRKENEALGPVRREAEERGEEAAAPQEEAVEETAATAEEPAESAPEPVAKEPEAFADDEPFAEGEPFADPPPAAEEPVAAEEPTPAASDTPTRGFDALSEDDIEDEPFADKPAPPAAEPPAGDSEDVLELTPEFLQETPEHDRLWFEQKPPRDFDFDDDEK